MGKTDRQPIRKDTLHVPASQAEVAKHILEYMRAEVAGMEKKTGLPLEVLDVLRESGKRWLAVVERGNRSNVLMECVLSKEQT